MVIERRWEVQILKRNASLNEFEVVDHKFFDDKSSSMKFARDLNSSNSFRSTHDSICVYAVAPTHKNYRINVRESIQKVLEESKKNKNTEQIILDVFEATKLLAEANLVCLSVCWENKYVLSELEIVDNKVVSKKIICSTADADSLISFLYLFGVK